MIPEFKEKLKFHSQNSAELIEGYKESLKLVNEIIKNFKEEIKK